MFRTRPPQASLLVHQLSIRGIRKATMNLRRSPLILSLGLVSTLLTAQELPKPGHGIHPADLDTAVKPCEDFYQYANGTWLKNTQIPSEYPVWGSFMEIYERNLEVLKGILEGVSAKQDWPKG
jgi:hypothetical protein